MAVDAPEVADAKTAETAAEQPQAAVSDGKPVQGEAPEKADNSDVDSEVGDSLISFDYAAVEEAQRIAAADLGKEGADEDEEQRKRKQRGGAKESQKRRKKQRREDDVVRAKQAGLPVPSLKELLAAAAAADAAAASAAETSTAAASSSSGAAAIPSVASTTTEPLASATVSTDTEAVLQVATKAPELETAAAADAAAPSSSATSPVAEAAARRLAKEVARRAKFSAALNARTVFVTNLHFKVTEREITEWMGACGTVKGVRMSKDKATGKPLGYAHVNFESPESVATAIEKCDRFDVQGRVVRVLRVGKGEKCQFDLPQELKDDIVALIRGTESRASYEGKNISTIKDAWQKQHPGQKLDTTKFGFKNFSAAMHTVEGLTLEHHAEKTLTFQAFFTGSPVHTAFLEAKVVTKQEAEVRAAAAAKAKAEAIAAGTDPAVTLPASASGEPAASASGEPAASASGEPAASDSAAGSAGKRPLEESSERVEGQEEAGTAVGEPVLADAEPTAKRRCVDDTQGRATCTTA